MVEVRSAEGEFLGIGTFNPKNSICVRLISREKRDIDTSFFAEKLSALDSRKRSLLSPDTTGYRICHADADGLPGLVVDRYQDVIVFQIHTLGMDLLRSQVLTALEQAFHPQAIVERSDLEARKMEGLQPLPPQVHQGDVDGVVAFLENGLNFLADVLHGQKTGFFLDQRDTRALVRSLAKDKSVVNLFGYTGAFSVAALMGGAKRAVTIDVSAPALAVVSRHYELNGLQVQSGDTVQADVIDLLRSGSLPFRPDLLICDPPAFAKTQERAAEAARAYIGLNQKCLEQLGGGGILITSSCSGRVTAEEFRNLLRIAAGQARKKVQLLSFHEHPVDHPQMLAFPEGWYLKTAVLMVL